MSDKLTIALPYSGQRYHITAPVGFKTFADYKLWGAGGGAGGRDSHYGGNGAGGNFVNGTVNFNSTSTISVFVGEGGVAGSSSSGGGQGRGGRSMQPYAGGTGGAAGWSGWSGGGGGGGGATLLEVDNFVSAVAGGGGGGGGGGNYSNGSAAYGIFNETPGINVYANGGTNGAWCNFLNSYSIWEGNGWYYWDVYFPTSDTYDFGLSIDNYGTLYIDGSEVVSAPNFYSRFSSTKYVAAGWHTISIYGINTGGPAAIGGQILNSSGGEIWNTRYEHGAVTHGYQGENHQGDGGGGGGGGGGYIGGTGGSAPWGDIGGYGGYNGGNFVIGYNVYAGQFSKSRTVANSTDADYPGSVGNGGYVSGAVNGQHGYALLTFYRAAGMRVKIDGAYRDVLPTVRGSGAYSTSTIPWVKVDGVWTIALSTNGITFSQDSTSWGG